MKQYIMGLITGASLLACAFVFMGTGRFNPNHIGRYVYMESIMPQYISILDTSTGNVFASRFYKNFQAVEGKSNLIGKLEWHLIYSGFEMKGIDSNYWYPLIK